jgi:transcriptional regulator with XRE-family HTH domain
MKGLSQKALANEVGVSRSTIQQLENGLLQNPSQDLLNRVSVALGVELLPLSSEKFGQVIEFDKGELANWFSAFTARSPDLAKEIRRFCAHLEEAKESKDEFLRRLAQQTWELTQSIYAGIPSRAVDVKEISSIQFWEDLVGQVKRRLQATSRLNPTSWWITPQGERYHQRNLDKCREGVSIERIFVFSTLGEAKEKKMMQIMSQQIEQGIRVHIALFKDLPPALAEDFLIADGEYVGWLYTLGRDEIAGSRFSANPNEVDRASKLFLQMKARAQLIENTQHLKDYLRRRSSKEEN